MNNPSLPACTLLFALSCAILPASAAEHLTVRLGPFERSINLTDLEEFANTGEIPSALRIYKPLLTPQVRELLSRQLYIEPSVADKFIDQLVDSSDGERLIEQLKAALPGITIEELKAAVYLALGQANGLSAIGLLRAYPEDNLVIDATEVANIALQINTSNLESQMVSPLLERELKVAKTIARASVAGIDPRVPGLQRVRQQTLILRDQQRDRRIPVELYYGESTRGPLIVMSQGFASNRLFLNYLAEHLASHGFTVASLEHPGSNIESIAEISLGLKPSEILPASEFIERPKDVSFLLDELEEIRKISYLKNKLNTEQVTVIGHSLGGYTALALTGGELNLQALQSFCEKRSPLGRAPADWLQCAASDLPDLVGKNILSLKDERIAQGIALNPLVGKIFGEKGLEKVDRPMMILTGTEDAITPSLDHQLRPFDKLQGEKYLLAAIGATHMSVNDVRNLNSSVGQSTLVKEVMGAEAEPLRQLISAMSLAFIQQSTSEAQTYQVFLQPAYAQSFSSSKITMRMTTELPTTLKGLVAAINLGSEQIAKTSPTKKRSSPNFLARFFQKIPNWFASKKSIPQAKKSTGELDFYFTDMLNNPDYINLS